MDASKTKFLKQNEFKLYTCTFELELFELRIFLRFPCKFFVEWKTTTGHKLTKTQGFVQNLNGKVTFNQKLTLEIQMLYESSKSTWIKKDSTISVYLITKNKPDFNQLVGRINIDLSTVCQNNPYKNPITQSLTYSSASADLKFSMNMKYSLMSKRTLSEVELHEFKQSFCNISQSLYSNKQNDLLNKSKSIDHLKNIQQVVSPVYQIAQSPISVTSQPKSVKPFHFPVSKLESYGHQVHEIVRQDNQQSTQFDMKMTLGKDMNPLTKKDYDQMIQEQTKGMKKSNLMVVPDMKKSRAGEDEFEFNTDHSKKTDQDEQKMDDIGAQNSALKKVGSDSQLRNRSKSPQQSQIDIVVDLSQAPKSKEKIEFNQNFIRNSLNSSSNSFSISRFRAQFQGTGEGFGKNTPIDPMASLQMPLTLKKHMSSHDAKGDIQKMAQKYEASKNRIKQLQTDVSELVKMLTDSRQKIQKLQDQNSKMVKLLEDLTFENSELQKRLDELEQKASYESRINQLNCEKLKVVSSQLTQQKKRASRSQDYLPDMTSFGVEIKSLKQTLKKLNFEKASLEEKLFRRDQIQLQNQIRIQELQQQLSIYRTEKLNSAPKVSPSALQLESKIVEGEKVSDNQMKQKEYISFLQEKIESLERENIKVKDMFNEACKNIEIYSERDLRMKQNIIIVQKEFENVVKLLLQRQKQLKQKILQIDTLKRKPSPSVFSQSAAQQAKYRALQQQVNNKNQILKFCQNQINLLEEQLAKTQLQNKQLMEFHKNNFRESIKFQGDLKVIKEEESYRESLASSGETFRMFASSKLSVKEENAVATYKCALKEYFTKEKIEEFVDIEFTAQIHDLRRKAFEQLERSAKIISQLMHKNEKIQSRLDQLQQQQKISAGSSNITPFSGHHSHKPSQQQITDQLSQATRKRSPINNQTKLSREVEKLKSLLYDKSKQMNDLISSYQKLRLEKQTQSMLMKSKKVPIRQRPSTVNDESDTELVHDLLDLQIRLNKEKEHKSQIMSELSLQKSLNKSQQISQYTQCDVAQIYKQLRAIILSRQNFITTQQQLNRLVSRINQLQRISQRGDRDYKLMYVVQEKSRSVSKEIQVMKSMLFKMNFKELQQYQYKTTLAGVMKPCQQMLNELLAAVEEMVNVYG